jgi:AAA+ ATPase superfamily predicted ATPase
LFSARFCVYCPPKPGQFRWFWREIYILLLAKTIIYFVVLAGNNSLTAMIVGRETETAILKQALETSESELIAVYGRRRVGKTFLIRNVYKDQLIFDFSGMHNSATSEQLESFTLALSAFSNASIPPETPKNWIRAFEMLKTYITHRIKRKKAVIFFDEFPWIDSHKSGFLQAFEHFWNSWASNQKKLVVVICGSAASWMIQKIVNNKGGLHNRITRRIRLLPFTLNEAETYLKSRRIILDRYQLLQLYMVLGGIPHYLKDIRPGESTAQNIDRMCFTKDGLLQNEFKNLYDSLFVQADKHIAVIRALAGRPAGLTRNEIIETCHFTTGGGITKLLEELLESGFIEAYIPFDKNVKQSIYKLSDEYSAFYLKFMEGSKVSGPGSWVRQSASSSWKSWSGMAFERICHKHIPQIKKALGIAAVYTQESAWRYAPKTGENGTQIDLLIDRQDFTINLCEIKFSTSEFTIDKKYASEIQAKVHIFRERTNTKKTVFPTMITTFGTRSNEYKLNLIQSEVKMESLFDKLS